jgi:hypothetical protein
VGQQIFTSSGTFTVPPNVTQVTVQCWGAGGGGGGGIATHSAGGGGGGAFSQGAVNTTPGGMLTVTVGTGGAGGTAGGSGADGGDSWFQTSGTVLAKGVLVGLQGVV